MQRAEERSAFALQAAEGNDANSETDEEPRAVDEIDDVFYWINDGLGPDARSDVDIMIRCCNAEHGNAIVKQLFQLLREVEGTPCAIFRTANTITCCRA